MIRDKGYPIVIDESAPSLYAPYLTASEEQGESLTSSPRLESPSLLAAKDNQPAALAPSRQPPQSSAANEPPKSAAGRPTSKQRVALGTVTSATTTFRLLPPKAPTNLTPRPQPHELLGENARACEVPHSEATGSPPDAGEPAKPATKSVARSKDGAAKPRKRMRKAPESSEANMEAAKPGAGSEGTVPTATSESGQQASVPAESELPEPNNDVEVSEVACTCHAS